MLATEAREIMDAAVAQRKKLEELDNQFQAAEAERIKREVVAALPEWVAEKWLPVIEAAARAGENNVTLGFFAEDEKGAAVLLEQLPLHMHWLGYKVQPAKFSEVAKGTLSYCINTEYRSWKVSW